MQQFTESATVNDLLVDYYRGLVPVAAASSSV